MNSDLTMKYEHVYDGALTAKIEITKPDFDQTVNERIIGYYNSCADALKNWFFAYAAPLSQKEYELSDDERKRWRYKPQMVSVKYKATEKSGIIRIETNAMIKETAGDERFRKKTEYWDNSTGRLLALRPSEKRWSHD